LSEWGLGDLNEGNDAKAYLREVASSINFLNKKAQEKVFERGLDVLTEVLALKKYAKRRIRETRDIARQEFLAGVQRYLIGFFEDSIYHSTLSVEMGLLTRLEEELSDDEKRAIHDRINSKKEKPSPFTFGVIFDESKRKGRNIIRNQQTEQRIAKIIDVRNTHIHASNFTSASILSMKQKGLPEIKKYVKYIDQIEEIPLVNVMSKKWLPQAKNLLNETQSAIERLPSFEWCTKDKQRAQAQENINNFFSEIFGSIDALQKIQSLSEKVQLGVHSRKFIRDVSERDYQKTLALETIRDSFAVLKSIGIFGAVKQQQRK
jgi:hypothetical protein